jgi:hypothetical protein
MTKDEPGESARILSFAQVQKRLTQYWETLAELPHRALERYKRQIASRFSQPSGRFRSNALHELMIDELRPVAGDSLITARGRSLLRAGDDLVVQFKKIDGSGRTSNVPTAAALAWETQLHLPGIPPAMRLTLGYRLDKASTEVVEVSLIARDGDAIIWRENVTSQAQLALTTPIRTANARPAVKKLAAKPAALVARGAKKKERKRGD